MRGNLLQKYIDWMQCKADINAHPCGCIGPQDGEPLCPCVMRARGIFKRDGRWIEPAQAERDLGPAQ